MASIPLSPKDVTETWLKNVMSDVLKWHNIKVVHLMPVTEKDGYMSGVFKAAVKNEETGETINLFIKVILPADDPFRQFMNDYSIDEVEVEGYRQHLPMLAKFEQEKIGTSELTEIYPKFYAGDYDLTVGSRGFYLIIEDICPKFKMSSAANGFTDEDITMVLAKIAQLHAVSYSYGQIQNVNYAKTKLRSKYEKFYHDPNMFKMAMDSFPILFEDIKAFKPHLLSAVNTFGKKQKEVFKDVFILEESRFLVHGDLWKNNVMFSDDDCRIVDWQFVSASHPMTDICMLVFTSTDPDLSERHMDKWIDEYYKKLSNTCAAFGLDPPMTIEDLKKLIFTTGLVMIIEMLILWYQATQDNAIMRDRFLWMIEKAYKNCPQYFTE